MWANWVIQRQISCHGESRYSPVDGDATLDWTRCVLDRGVFPLQTCLRSRWRCDACACARQRAGLVNFVRSCKEMRCHENKTLAMLACAACARGKQYLLGQLLKEIQINQIRKNATPNIGCKLFLSGWVSGHPLPLPQTDNIPSQYKDMTSLEIEWRGLNPDIWSPTPLQSAHLRTDQSPSYLRTYYFCRLCLQHSLISIRLL